MVNVTVSLNQGVAVTKNAFHSENLCYCCDLFIKCAAVVIMKSNFVNSTDLWIRQRSILLQNVIDACLQS